MNIINKKIVAGILGVSMSLMMVPGYVSGATVAELQAQIDELLAKIAGLQSQIADLGGAPAGAPAACSGITFTANLSQGSTGNAVKCLQALLNQSSDTQVAASGVGSAGNETTYFGSLTKAAVMKYQEKNAADVLTPLGLTAGTGFVGSATRAKLNAWLAGPTPTPPTPPTPGVTTPGKEGTLSVSAHPTPPSGQTIYAGRTEVEVAGLKVKALGSDVNVNRIDFNFTTRPWLNFTKAALYDDSTKLVSMDVTSANTIEVTAGSSYNVRLTGFNWVVPEGVEKVLSFKVDPMLQPGDSSETLTYRVQANGVRGTDGKNIQQYAPSAALTDRTFVVESQAGALQLAVNANNPKERGVIGSRDVKTENVELLTLDLKATVNDVIVSTILTNVVTDGPSGRDALQTLKLYDGATLLAATSSVHSAPHAFSPLNLRIAKDTTKTLSIKADLEIANAGRDNASTSVALATGGVTASDAGTFASVTVSGAAATGNTIHLYTAAPQLKLVSTSIATDRAGRAEASSTKSANGKIKFEVTALGGDVYVGSTTGIVASTSNSIVAPGLWTPPTLTTTRSSNGVNAAEGNWLVRQNETRWFEIASFITNASSTAMFLDEFVRDFVWATSSPTGGTTTFTWNWTDIQNDYRTSDVYLQGKDAGE